MRQRYKNGKEKLKAELQSAKGDLVRKQMVLDDISRQLKEKTDLINKQAEEKKKRYSATVFCTNCRYVCNVTVPAGCKVEEGNCIHCQVISRPPISHTLFLVQDYPGKGIFS